MIWLSLPFNNPFATLRKIYIYLSLILFGAGISISLNAQVKLVSSNAKPVKTGAYMTGTFATLFKEKKLVIVYPKKAPVNGKSAENFIDVWDHKINKVSSKKLDVTPDEKAMDFVEKGFVFNEKIYLLFSKFNKKEKSYSINYIVVDDKGEVEEPKELMVMECTNVAEMQPVSYHFSEDHGKLLLCVRQGKKKGKSLDWLNHFVILNTEDWSVEKKETYTFGTSKDQKLRSWCAISSEGRYAFIMTETSEKEGKVSQKIQMVHKEISGDNFEAAEMPNEGFRSLSNAVLSFINKDSILVSGFYSDKGIDDANGMIYYIFDAVGNTFPTTEVIELPGNAKKELKHFDPKKNKSKSTVIRIGKSQIIYVSDTCFLLTGLQSDEATIALEQSGKVAFHLDEDAYVKKNVIFSLIGYDGTLYWSKVIQSNGSYIDTFGNEAMAVVLYNEENKLYRVGLSGDLNMTKLGKPKPEAVWSINSITRTSPTQFTAIGYKAPKGFDPIFVNLVDLTIALRKSKVEVPKKEKKR